jgi:hypothetical protein
MAQERLGRVAVLAIEKKKASIFVFHDLFAVLAAGS